MNKTTMMTEPKDCKEVFGLINERQILALMIHSEMADMFGFLGLDGFRQIHEYQFLAESKSHRDTKIYYLKHHGKLLPDREVNPTEVIPDEWVQYTRADVTPAVRLEYTKQAMQQYHEWEEETKELLCKYASYLLAWHKIADFNEVNHLICDVSEELNYLEQLCLELNSVEYDAVYVLELQDMLCEKYKFELELEGDN